MTTDAAEQRSLPENLEAECAVLGAILLDGAPAFERVAEQLQACNFFRAAHQRVFQAMQAVVERKAEIDFVTVKEQLRQCGWLEDVGGPAYLSSLVDGLPHATNIRHYAEIIRDKAMLRALIMLSTRTLTDAYEATREPSEILQRADRDLLNLQVSQGWQGLERQRAGHLFEDLERRVANKGQLTGVDTGFQSVNDLTMGWQAGDLVIVAARPSIGKTTLVLNTAVAAAQTGVTVAIFSLEMRRAQLEYRMLAGLSGVALSKILGGYLSDADYPRITQALTVLDALPLYMNDRCGQTAFDIRMACRRLRSEQGLGLVVIDYVQLMPGSLDRRGSTRNEEVTDISRRLKALAGECAVPVLLVSQLNRAGESRSDPRPRLSDLRESGALEQDADIVVLLHRKNHREGGVTNCIFEKQRNGPTGTVNLTLDRDITLFTDGGEEPIPPPAEAEEEKKERNRRIFGRKNR